MMLLSLLSNNFLILALKDSTSSSLALNKLQPVAKLESNFSFPAESSFTVFAYFIFLESVNSAKQFAPAFSSLKVCLVDKNT